MLGRAQQPGRVVGRARAVEHLAAGEHELAIPAVLGAQRAEQLEREADVLVAEAGAEDEQERPVTVLERDGAVPPSPPSSSGSAPSGTTRERSGATRSSAAASGAAACEKNRTIAASPSASTVVAR